MPVSRSAQRAMLLGLVLAAGAFQLTNTPSPLPDASEAAVRALLVRSGFRVHGLEQTWLNDEIKGHTYLRGEHPLCRTPVTVSQLSLDDRPPADSSVIYIYDDWQGAFPSRLALLWRAARLELRSALSFGRISKPPRAILAITDPSACLALTAVDWRPFWGSSGAGTSTGR